ncbi:hypothetical protein V8F06_007666 [Rhypophila decipiens]
MIIPASKIPTVSRLYETGKLLPPSESHIRNFPSTLLGPKSLPAPDQSLNDRIAYCREDITTLGVDAIVNAANDSLLGGGGVDGAIHRAAGRDLYRECKKLGGCETGSAKITDAYELPCKKVIHAVGPIYDSEDHDESEELLTGCYTKSLELAVENGCRTIAFSAISTGVYGYPSALAAPAALSAIRKFLEEDKEKKISKAVIVTFVPNDVNAYMKNLPLFFPPVADKKSDKGPSQEKDEENKEAETLAKSDKESSQEKDKESKDAETLAKKLPSVPTAEPSEDKEHVEKKQKVSDDV